MLQTLSNEALRQRAPSVFAASPFHDVSDKYTFVDTASIIERLRGEGLVPVSVRQARTRTPGKHGFQRHEVRLVEERLLHSPKIVGGTYPQVCLTNSHDTSAALAIEAGLYRLVCSNGMMVPDQLAQSVRVRHTGDLHDVIEGVFSVVEESRELNSKIEEYQGIQLPLPARLAFASAALELRESTLPLTPDQILRPRRREDTGVDLYTTLNVVQEHLVKGGNRSRTATGRRTTTRAMTDISADQRLNKALWVLAEQLKVSL